MSRLSKSEFVVQAYIAAGYEIKEIASLLFRSPHTIATHVKRIKFKLGVKNLAEMSTSFALAHGDPKNYLKLLLVWIQLAMSFASYDFEIRNVRKCKPHSIARARAFRTRNNDFIYG